MLRVASCALRSTPSATRVLGGDATTPPPATGPATLTLERSTAAICVVCVIVRVVAVVDDVAVAMAVVAALAARSCKRARPCARAGRRARSQRGVAARRRPPPPARPPPPFAFAPTIFAWSRRRGTLLARTRLHLRGAFWWAEEGMSVLGRQHLALRCDSLAKLGMCARGAGVNIRYSLAG